MKNILKILSLYCVAALIGLFTACEKSGESDVFETLDQLIHVENSEKKKIGFTVKEKMAKFHVKIMN